MEGASANHSLRDQGKESLDLIQPRTTGGREMKMEAAPFFGLEPPLYLSTFVRAVVVHDQVDLLIPGKLAFQVIQKTNELAAAVPLLTGADHLSVEKLKAANRVVVP